MATDYAPLPAPRHAATDIGDSPFPGEPDGGSLTRPISLLMNPNCAQCRFFARHVFPGMLEHYSGFCRKPMERPVELNGTFWPMVRDEDVCYQYQYQDIVLTSSDFPPHVASTSQADYPPVSAASPEFRHSDSAPGQAAPCESATPVTGPGFIPPLPVPFGVSTPEVVPPARAASSTSRARPLVHVYRAGLPDRKGTTGKAQKSFGPNPFRRTPPARMGSGTFQTVS